jgi:HEAT repeat protein
MELFSLKFRYRLQPLFGTVLVLLVSLTWGCGLRTIPPVRYVPILGKEKEIKTTQVLVRALGDSDLDVRAQAVELLGTLAEGSDKSVKQEAARVLGIALKDRDPGIRLQAVEKLGTIEDDFGNKYLLKALKDPNPFVRQKVLEVLTQRQILQSLPQAPPPQATQASKD